MALGHKTGGRKKGVPNKASNGLKAAFQKHEKELVQALLDLTKSDDENVRLRAVVASIERGWGRAPQDVTVGGEIKVTWQK